MAVLELLPKNVSHFLPSCEEGVTGYYTGSKLYVAFLIITKIQFELEKKGNSLNELTLHRLIDESLSNRILRHCAAGGNY